MGNICNGDQQSESEENSTTSESTSNIHDHDCSNFRGSDRYKLHTDHFMHPLRQERLYSSKGPLLGKGSFGFVYDEFRFTDRLRVAIKHVIKESIDQWNYVSKK